MFWPTDEVGGRRVVESTPGTRAEEDEGSLTSEQQLGLRQAEERLRRDYIHRLVKVRTSLDAFQIWPNMIFKFFFRLNILVY